MKTILLAVSLFSLTGCIPSLCLFNCGESSSVESRKNSFWDDRSMFEQNGKKWQCQLGENIASEAGKFELRKAICLEIK